MGAYSEEKLREYLRDAMNTRVLCFENIDSTNSEAKRLVREEKYDDFLSCGGRVLIVSDSQSCGRGRMGRSFYSPSDTGVYMSLLYFDKKNMTDAVRITSAAAVAVADALERVYGISPKIKWVNDLYLNDRKICGILAEALVSGDTNAMIIGIGINLVTSDFPSDIRDIAGSIGKMCDREWLIAQICSDLYRYMEDIMCPDIMQGYRRRFMLCGSKVKVMPPLAEKVSEGVVIGVDDDGALLLQDDDGGMWRLSTGEVSIKI